LLHLLILGIDDIAFFIESAPRRLPNDQSCGVLGMVVAASIIQDETTCGAREPARIAISPKFAHPDCSNSLLLLASGMTAHQNQAAAEVAD
jgi:hypothetical protein